MAYRRVKSKGHAERACVTVNRQRAYIALKQNVDPKNWDGGKGAAKGNKEEVKSINNYLEEVGLVIGNIYKELGSNHFGRAICDLII